jgi:hypothetical protein
MDYELMGRDARAAIVAESAKLGAKPFLPPMVPFGSKRCPMRITPGAPDPLPSLTFHKVAIKLDGDQQRQDGTSVRRSHFGGTARVR